MNDLGTCNPAWRVFHLRPPPTQVKTGWQYLFKTGVLDGSPDRKFEPFLFGTSGLTLLVSAF